MGAAYPQAVVEHRLAHAIARALADFRVPFIDVGLGVGQEGGALDGVLRVTAVHPDGPGWENAAKYLPFADREEDDYDTEIQIADLNALNAALAVLRWKRFAGFYRDERREMNSTYMIEGDSLANRES